MLVSRVSALLAAAAGGLLLAGCATATTDGPAGGATGSPTSGTAGDRLRVVAAFYPLQYAAQRVGGDAVDVTNLTAPGAEPHDLELTAQQVAEIGAADLVLYVPGFQPAVDRAVEQQAKGTAIDVTQGLTMLAGHADDGHADDGHADDAQAATGTDPHVWLNPLNMATIGRTIESRLRGLDPAAATSIAANQTRFAGDMAALDRDWTAGTTTCTSRDLVVSHEAFGYLADRYRFRQLGISGLSPETEPSAAKVAEVADFVRANGVTTIYFETLVDPKVAQTVAGETGAATAVLDPLEGLAPDATGDYTSIMRQNLTTVRTGQGCS